MSIILELHFDIDFFQITCSKESKNMEVEKDLKVIIIFYIKRCLSYELEKRFTAPELYIYIYIYIYIYTYTYTHTRMVFTTEAFFEEAIEILPE